jgi:hypothetical protein
MGNCCKQPFPGLDAAGLLDESGNDYRVGHIAEAYRELRGLGKLREADRHLPTLIRCLVDTWDFDDFFEDCALLGITPYICL